MASEPASEGSGNARKIKLTELAVKILNHPSPVDRAAAIKEAALTPPIFRELLAQYNDGLPTDQMLLWELEQERGFSATGAKEFIPVYKATLSFAKVLDGASFEPQDDESGEGDDDDDDEPEPEKSKRRRRVSGDASVLTIPLVGGASVVVEGAFPIAERDWDQFMAVLNAMKPGLIAPEEADD